MIRFISCTMLSFSSIQQNDWMLNTLTKDTDNCKLIKGHLEILKVLTSETRIKRIEKEQKSTTMILAYSISMLTNTTIDGVAPLPRCWLYILYCVLSGLEKFSNGRKKRRLRVSIYKHIFLSKLALRSLSHATTNRNYYNDLELLFQQSIVLSPKWNVQNCLFQLTNVLLDSVISQYHFKTI